MWKRVVITLVIFGGLGYWGYNFALSKVSGIMVEQVANQVFQNEDEYKKIMNDPEVQKIINELDNPGITGNELPFDTKEEAFQTVMKEFSIGEINEIASMAQNGKLDATEIEQMLQERFSEEEIQALKIIAIREFQKNEE